MKENNEVVTNENVKKSIKPVGFKVCLGLIIAMVVVVIATVGTILGLSAVVSNMDLNKSNSFMTDVMLMVMPESVEDEDGTGLTFYVEKNEDYNAQTDQAIDTFNFYYKDTNGEKQYIENGMYVDENGEDSLVAVGFMLAANAKAETIKQVLVTVAIIAGIVFFGLVIWLSYYIWLANEEKKESADNKNKLKLNNKK